ncbi:MAG TPA: pyridoxamine 5'-phosphate oxidase family protein [Candidatus Saccharimonadales bacterium]|nr:pyridoxamine 5'-phosphate oxidase family protein [Candidatus Saccharimonadales bacterium]
MSTLTHAEEIISYITHHPVMVVSTVDVASRPDGAAVYVFTSSLKHLYFITKTQTQKFENITQNQHVALTSYDMHDNSSLQITGAAHAVHEATTIEMVMSNMSAIYAKSSDWLPPIAKFRAGPYQVVRVTLQHARLARYKDAKPGDPHIFKEVSASDL